MNGALPSEPPSVLLRARWVAPMSAPIIADGVVLIRNGRIAGVGRANEIAREGATPLDLGDVVLMPGLINAHTHLELSDQTPGEPTATFGDWLTRIITRRMSLGDGFTSTIAAATRAGAAECLRFGVTTVGDISRECGITRPVLRDGPLRVVSFGEVQALAMRRTLLDERLRLAIDDSGASDSLSIALSPHAPYTVEPDGYRACVSVARRHSLRLCTHLAETLEEREFLASGTGPLRELWDRLGAWDDHVPRTPDGPIALARDVGLLDVPSLLAHVNYASDDELATLATGRAAVVWCPRTHAYFGHPPHRWREMLARGINVCIGTDSRASSPDLNVVDDLRLVHRQSPDVDPHALWQMVTTRAARALALVDVGRIEPGCRADLVAFPCSRADDPLRAVIESDAQPSALWIGGEAASGPASDATRPASW